MASSASADCGPNAVGGATLKSLSQSLSDLLQGGEGRRRQALADASMAAAALVATARGDVSFAERALIDQAVDALAARGVAPPHAAVAAFDAFVDAIRANSSQGRRPALEAVSAFGGAADAAAVVLKIAEAVAAADGSPSAEEITVVREIGDALAAAAR